MPFDDLRTVVAVAEIHEAELSCSIQRGRERVLVACGDMDPSSTTERTSTTTTVEDSEAGTSPIEVSSDAIQLNDICPVDDPLRQASPEDRQSTGALESSSCNKSSKRDQGDLSGRVDNGPSASTSKAGGVVGVGGATPLPESLRHPRKSLPLLPRMSQYERHPLLQVRSGTGMSEFELFLLEKEIFKKRCSVDDQHPLDSAAETAAADDADAGAAASSAYPPHRPSSSSSVRGVVQEEKRGRLIPRSAHYEPHPLLRKSISGVCELELYLMEKEEEVNRREREANNRDDDDDDDDDDDRTTTKGDGGRRWKLEPRLNQWEKHALLEVKDKSGLSEVDRFFLETEQQQQQQEEERGKCGAECVCKSATCKRCKKQQQQQQQQKQQQHQALQSPTSSLQQSLEAAASASSVWKGDSSKTSDDSSSSASATAAAGASSATGPLLVSQQRPSGQQRRVHFERQKNEADDSGIASSDVSCQATRQDDVSAPEVSLRNSSATYGRQTKGDVEAGRDEATGGGDDARKSQRGKGFRTDKQQSGNKSCCMS